MIKFFHQHRNISKDLSGSLFTHHSYGGFMAQTRLVATGITSKADADKIAQAGEAVEGVRFVNVNHEDGGIVITHSDAFNADTFKSAIQALGFGF
jgi:copper chaperone CopZ